MSIWVVIADSSRARIMTAADGRSPLVEERDFSHSESRLREQDLVAGRGGSGSDGGGHGRHSMGHEDAAQQHEEEVFAQALCAEIEKRRQQGDLWRFYLIAPPKFLGRLRKHLSKPCGELVAGEIGKNLVKHGVDDIRDQLPKLL